MAVGLQTVERASSKQIPCSGYEVKVIMVFRIIKVHFTLLLVVRSYSERHDLKLGQKIRHAGRFDGLIDNKPHGAFFGMCANKDDAFLKPLITHSGHRDQKLATQGA